MVIRRCLRTDIETFEEIDGLCEGMLPFESVFEAEHTNDSPSYITGYLVEILKISLPESAISRRNKLLVRRMYKILGLGTNSITTKTKFQ